jgi:hypothetical protein
MSILKMIAKPAAVVLTVASMACMAATAEAQSTKRVVIAMAPADQSPMQEAAKPAQTHAAATVAPRAKHVAMIARAPKSENSDCFWCNRTVYISGLTY